MGSVLRIAIKSMAFVVFSAGILLLAPMMLTLPIAPNVGAPPPPPQSFTLDAIFQAWNNTSTPNPTLSVVQGNVVALNLRSGDSATHQFYVDVNKNTSPDCSSPDPCSSLITPTSTPVSLQFPADFAPGSYTYYCSKHPTYMHGSFVVNAAPAYPNFVVSASPGSISVGQGASATSSISIASQNSFSGALALSTNTSSSGLSWRLSPTGVTLTAGATATSVLTVNASASTPTGAYQTVVTVTNGTMTQSAFVTVNVTSSASAPSLGYLLEIGGAVTIAAIGIVGILWYRASRMRAKRIKFLQK
jgi:plastocyanin